MKILKEIMKIKLCIIFLTSFLLFSNGLFATCKRVAVVKSELQDGWSKKYTVEITFSTGFELNEATKTSNYNSFSVYAVIFWKENQASVIKLTSTLLCGTEVTCKCVDNTITDLQGYDQDGDKWNICLGDFCN